MSVFRPSRIKAGVRVVSKFYAFHYTDAKTGQRKSKGTGTKDKGVAERREHDFLLEKQQEDSGMIARKSQREAAATSLADLLASYEDYLATDCKPKHVHDTTTRVRRMFSEMHWRYLADARADKFGEWLFEVKVSAKTKLEFQRSLKAFFNWLVQTDRIEKSPIAKLRPVEIRGKQVRACRSFSEDELRRLFVVAGKRRLAYLILTYTGQRKSEVRALVWGDLHLDDAKPYALFRAETTKDKDKRAVALRPEIAQLLREAKASRPTEVAPTDKVFWFCWPTYDLLRADLKRAGIERKDRLGRVVHFHSFRKTWQTLGVRYGVNQRFAQEVLGHSDANLTAQVYTDVPALGMDDEMGKLPWITSEAPEPDVSINVQNSVPAGHVLSFSGNKVGGEKLKKAAGAEELSHDLAHPVTTGHECVNGCPSWDRTSDQVINSHLLCH